MTPEADYVKHELCHVIGATLAGAVAVRITRHNPFDYETIVDDWGHTGYSQFKDLKGIIAGRVFVPADGDTGVDESYVAQAPVDVVKELEASFLPLVAKKLNEFPDAEIEEILEMLQSGQDVVLRQIENFTVN